MSAKVTPWFPADVKPVHVGVYERQYRNEIRRVFTEWNGKEWGWGFVEGVAIPSGRFVKGPFQDLPWRGLAKKP